jgi:hypothetical protein
MVLRYNFLSFSWPHVSSDKILLSFCLPFTNDLLDCGMALHHNIPSFWLVTQVPAINYNFSILYRINYWVVAWSFATLSYVLASYTSMSKTSQPITSSISKNLKVLLVKFRTKKELTACLVASSAIYWASSLVANAVANCYNNKKKTFVGLSCTYERLKWLETIVNQKEQGDTLILLCDFQVPHPSKFFPESYLCCLAHTFDSAGDICSMDFCTKNSFWVNKTLIKFQHVFCPSIEYVRSTFNQSPKSIQSMARMSLAMYTYITRPDCLYNHTIRTPKDLRQPDVLYVYLLMYVGESNPDTSCWFHWR